MKNLFGKTELVLIFLGSLICLSTYASNEKVPRRISSKYVDMGKPQTIYMIPGMATLIELPTTIQKIRVGNSEDVQYTKPDRPENEITLFLKSAHAKPTNLFLISGKNKYIFDIVPSKTVHQDYIEVVGAFGGPSFEGSGESKVEVIDSSDLPAKPLNLQKKGGKNL